MELSKQGIDLLIDREAVRLKAYKDSKGIWTIGIGHTGPEVKEGLVWTRAQVDEAFRHDIQWAVDAVNKVKSALLQHQFDALVSFTFNVGKEGFLGSTMKRLLDSGNYGAAAKEFDKWHKPPEVTTRRNGERDQFKGIDFVARK